MVAFRLLTDSFGEFRNLIKIRSLVLFHVGVGCFDLLLLFFFICAELSFSWLCEIFRGLNRVSLLFLYTLLRGFQSKVGHFGVKA